MLFRRSSAAVAQFADSQLIEVTAGNVARLTSAIQSANQFTGVTFIEIVEGPGGISDFGFTMPFGTTSNALPAVVGNVVVSPDFDLSSGVTFRAEGTDFCLFEVGGNGSLGLNDCRVESFSNPASGGVVLVSDDI